MDYIRTYYPVLVNVLNNFYPSVTDNTTNLISKGVGVSASYGDYAFIDRSGPVTYYNALYVVALKNAASIATYLGETSDAATWTARAETVSAAINTYNWDDSVGAFFDGYCSSDSTSYCPTHAQDGNSISILSGAANSSRATSALSYLSANNNRTYGNSFYDNDVVSAGYSDLVYAFISYFEIQARFQSGLAPTALEQIRRMYGWMEASDPGITMWEGIGASGLPYEGAFTSLCHGWSTGVVSLLTNYILGVIPTGSGFNTYSIKPIPGDVTWANGVVPTPSGPISVYWESDAVDGLFYLSVNSPAGTNGTISVPVPNSSVAVYVGSTLAWQNDAPTAAYPTATFEAYAETGYVSVVLADADHVVTVGFASS